MVRPGAGGAPGAPPLSLGGRLCKLAQECPQERAPSGQTMINRLRRGLTPNAGMAWPMPPAGGGGSAPTPVVGSSAKDFGRRTDGSVGGSLKAPLRRRRS
eukprot:4355612-Pyramimonas_sp.AAC.1